MLAALNDVVGTSVVVPIIAVVSSVFKAETDSPFVLDEVSVQQEGESVCAAIAGFGDVGSIRLSGKKCIQLNLESVTTF